MGYEGTNTDATVQELYKVFINQKDIYQRAVDVGERFASGLFSDLWINTKFIAIAKTCIRIYGNQYCDDKWTISTIADGEIVSALAIKLKEYVMTEVAENEPENI